MNAINLVDPPSANICATSFKAFTPTATAKTSQTRSSYSSPPWIRHKRVSHSNHVTLIPAKQRTWRAAPTPLANMASNTLIAKQLKLKRNHTIESLFPLLSRPFFLSALLLSRALYAQTLFGPFSRENGLSVVWPARAPATPLPRGRKEVSMQIQRIAHKKFSSLFSSNQIFPGRTWRG